MVVDSQEFGIRVNGTPINPYDIDSSQEVVETLEIEALDRGSILFQTADQLPVAFYTPEQDYYRLYSAGISEERFPTVKLDRLGGNQAEWESTGEYDRLAPAIERLAEETDMIAVTGDADDVAEHLDKCTDTYKGAHTAKDEIKRERMAMQKETAFSPDAPSPMQVRYPNVVVEQE
ncbi:hypothetical protein HLRTI_000498 [Halorhabdus tiamatea SARL4B]|uniref:Uncharacterized protein n=2 Tax=Halorhabdus TaxID=146825 RepID=F7PMJ2_9EURY|nr:hypothetical protein HLRTI_000498 [Halorhabdus tiamatea SARL4B]